MEMTAEWTRIMQKQIGRSGWFDAFGELHMAYCSKTGTAGKRTVLHAVTYL